MSLRSRVEHSEKSYPKKGEPPIKFIICSHSEEVGPDKEDLDRAEKSFTLQFGEPVISEYMDCNKGIILARGVEMGKYDASPI